jgi:outer membrane protein TolC
VRIWIAPLVWALVVSGSAAGEGRAPLAPEPLALSWCLERAAGSNPQLAAQEAGAAAARERVAPAGALADPRFGYEASNVPVGRWDFSSTPLSGHQFRLAQELPFPGLLGSRKAAARAAAEAEGAALVDRRVELAAQVERAWAELGFAQRALEITQRNAELLRRLVRIAEARYRVGNGLQQDVLRAHVELTALLQQELRRRAAVESAEAALAALLDLPPETALARTAPLAEPADLPDLAGLLERAEAHSPRLQVVARRVEAAERSRRAAQLEGYPSFDLSAGYRLRSDNPGDPVSGDDFVHAGVTIRLPVNRTRWRARVAEQDALLRRARAEQRAERAALRDRVRSAFAELVRADREVALIESGLLPQARQSLESSRAGYEVGRVDFPSLLDIQIRLLGAELRQVRATVDRRAAFAVLEAAVGEALR